MSLGLLNQIYIRYTAWVQEDEGGEETAAEQQKKYRQEKRGVRGCE